MTKTMQLDHWADSFGDEYTERNVVAWQDRVEGFEEILTDLDVASVLEVGCNRGHNLQALQHILAGAEVVGVEPNGQARAIAEQNGCTALAGDAYDLPVADASHELVFTAGVLIHVALEDLPAALDEIHRASSRYILAVEYHAAKETPIEYRGRHDLLWKRDFAGHYEERFADLHLVREGYLGENSGFDRCHWWLFEKGGDRT